MVAEDVRNLQSWTLHDPRPLRRRLTLATPDDVRLFQLDLIESGLSIPNRNRIMSGAKFLFRVTLRRLDLVSEVFHMKEPSRVPLILSQDETKRLLAMAGCLRDRLPTSKWAVSR